MGPAASARKTSTVEISATTSLPSSGKGLTRFPA